MWCQRQQRWVVNKSGERKRLGTLLKQKGKAVFFFFFRSILCSSVECSLTLFIGQNGGIKCYGELRRTGAARSVLSAVVTYNIRKNCMYGTI